MNPKTWLEPEPGWKQELYLDYPQWVPEAHTLGLSSATSSSATAGTWMGSRAAQTGTGAPIWSRYPKLQPRLLYHKVGPFCRLCSNQRGTRRRVEKRQLMFSPTDSGLNKLCYDRKPLKYCYRILSNAEKVFSVEPKTAHVTTQCR